jgi:hypothetical protein
MISTDKYTINTSFNDYHPSTPVSNMPFDESIELRNSDYMSSDILEISDDNEEISQMEREDNQKFYNIYPPEPPINNLETILSKIGDGKMEYIEDSHNKIMMTNAWEAITQTNNWDFVSQKIESFMWSNDPRIYDIMEKMEELGYDGHSGSSFGCTMRNMQFLAQKGEEEFKKLLIKPKKD